MNRPILALVLALATLLPAVRASAQALAGRITHADGRPAEAVQLVALALTEDRVLARTLTSRSGAFRLSVGEPQVRLRVLRIGFAPAELGTVHTQEPSALRLAFTLPAEPTRLPPVSAVAVQPCRAVGEAAAELASLFDDVRVALATIRLGMLREEAPIARAVLREQLTDLRDRPASPVHYRVLAGRAVRPFQALDEDTLRRVGYVTQEPDGVVYRAPDSDVLASDEFLRAHCLQFVAEHPEEPAWVGIGFEPLPRPRAPVSIRGTFWVDRQTRAVRRLEFGYVGLPRELDAHRLGGSVEFGDLPDGTWFESAWTLRMAKTFADTRSGRVRVEAFQTLGGHVVDMRRGSTLLYLGDAGLVERITLVEDAGGDGWTEAAGLASDAVRLCASDGADAAADSLAGVYGLVLDADRSRVAGTRLVGRWRNADVRRVSLRRDGQPVEEVLRWTDREVTTVTDADGFFRMCDLPPAQAIEFELQVPGRDAQRITIRTPDAGRDVRVELAVMR